MNIIERIAQLRKMIPENGASEEEALSALNMADRLMQKHGVTEADLRKVEFARDMKTGRFKQKQKAEHPCTKYCGPTIQKFCGIRVWYNTRASEFQMFGMNEDIDMAEYLTKLIHDSMDRGWKEYISSVPKGQTGSSRHTEYWSFMLAFAIRVNQKMNEIISQRPSSTGTDLVVLKDQIVEQGMKVLLPNLRISYSSRSKIKLNGDALSAGADAGDKVNLNRPLNNSGGGRMIK